MPPTVASEVQKEVQKETAYFMFYRHGMSPINFKGFKHNGDLKSAQQRAYKHAEIMGYKNVWVTPQLCDLDTEEKRYNGKTDDEIVTQPIPINV